MAQPRVCNRNGLAYRKLRPGQPFCAMPTARFGSKSMLPGAESYAL